MFRLSFFGARQSGGRKRCLWLAPTRLTHLCGQRLKAISKCLHRCNMRVGAIGPRFTQGHGKDRGVCDGILIRRIIRDMRDVGQGRAAGCRISRGGRFG